MNMNSRTKKQQQSIQALFTELALPSDELSIRRFMKYHKLTPDIMLADANFWNEKQLNFILDAIWMDSDWADPLDKLDLLLRK